MLKLTKVLFSRTANKEEDDYLNYLSLGYKIEWNEEIIYFPFELGDEVLLQKIKEFQKSNLKIKYTI